MGKTKSMIRYEEFMRKQQIKQEHVSPIGVLTEEMKEKAGMNYRYMRDFSGGCSGLKKIHLKNKKK